MKTTNALMVILGIYLIATAITTIVLIYKANTSISEDTTLYNEYKSNYITSTLESVAISYEPCQAPYTPLFGMQIEGTKAYCSCYGSYSYMGACNSRSYFCKTTFAKPSFTVYLYRGVYLCGLRTQYNYDQLNPVVDGKCPPNYQVCGSDTETPLCYPASASCPVNDLVISDEIRPDLENQNYSRVWVSNGNITNADGSTTKPKSSNSQYTSANFYVYFTNKKTANPVVVDFRLGYSAICVSPTEERAPVTQSQFLDRKYATNCTSAINERTEDPNFKQIASVNKKALWNDNNVFLKLGAIPKFDIESIDYSLGLFMRSYVHIEPACIAKINEKKGNNYTKSGFMDKMAVGNRTSLTGYLIAIIFLCVLYGFCSGVFCAISLSERAKKSENMFLMHCVCLFLIVVVVLVAILLSRQLPSYSLIRTLKDENCGGDIVNSMTSGEYGDGRKIINYYIIVLSLTAAGMLFYFGLLFLKDTEGDMNHQYAEMNDRNQRDHDAVIHTEYSPHMDDPYKEF